MDNYERDAQKLLRKIIGDKNPEKARLGTLRNFIKDDILNANGTLFRDGYYLNGGHAPENSKLGARFLQTMLPNKAPNFLR